MVHIQLLHGVVHLEYTFTPKSQNLNTHKYAEIIAFQKLVEKSPWFSFSLPSSTELSSFLSISFIYFRWGCSHEADAVKAYIEAKSATHSNFRVQDAGLFISLEKPYIGATPDGIVMCDCCQKRTLEVKCPHCFKDNLPDEDVKGFCMKKDERGSWTLRRDHTYYYQVQVQLNVCEVESGDFVVWTKGGIVVETIFKDKRFYDAALPLVEHFFVYGVLPEIIGKWYTRKAVADESGVVQLPVIEASTQETDDAEDPTKLWCYCSQPTYGNMVLCDNYECTIQWFHFDCLRIHCPPKGKWYCPSCSKLPQFRRKHHALTKKI